MRLNFEVERHREDEFALRNDEEMLKRHGGETAQAYVKFYAERQDQIIQGDPDTWEKTNRIFQIEWLRNHGLRPEQRFLDYGCGTVSAGKHMIEFLYPQKYVGVDISQKSIERGWEILLSQGYYKKAPMLHHIPDGDLSMLEGLAFDVIWAQSVFTHCPPEVIKKILGRWKTIMHPNSRAFASISKIARGVAQKQLHNWYYNLEFFQDLAPHCGMKVEVMPDWKHPYAFTNEGFAEANLLCFSLT